MPSSEARQADYHSKNNVKLEDEREHFALAERAAKIGYWRYDLATAHITWSAGLYRLLGTDPARQKPDVDWLCEQMWPEDAVVLKTSVSRAVNTGTPFSFRSRMGTPRATTKVIETQGEVEIGANGHATAIIGVCSDVTERAAVETSWRQVEQMYRVIAEQASDIIVLYDDAGHVLYASNALQRLLKRAPEEIEGQRFLDIVHADDLAEAKKLSAKREPGETLTATYRARHSAGHYLWIETTTRAIYDETGTHRNTVSVSRDITGRKQHEAETAAARDRAEAANLAKSTFLANMSHELRTPLNAILGFADIMRQKMFGPVGAARYEEYVQLIHESGETLLGLISDIVDMAKIEAGRFELNFEPVDLRMMAGDCALGLEERAAQREVTLKTELPKKPATVDGDPRALKQILHNLLSNAVKFTLSGGTVTLRVRALPNGNMLVEVQDNGIGIPASELPRLGRPFEQICIESTLSKGGAGLGLALVRALAEKHGGSMRIESEEGAGTTASIELPLSQDSRAAA